MTTISLDIPSGPHRMFEEGIQLPERLPVAIEGRDEPVMARVLHFEVLPRNLRVTLEIDENMPALELGARQLAA